MFVTGFRRFPLVAWGCIHVLGKKGKIMTIGWLANGSAAWLPLASESVHCAVTSPPYWGLRKYAGEQGVWWPAVTYAPMAGLAPLTVPAMRAELGLEPTAEAFVAHIVLAMREVWRVLRDDGTFWLNFGDSYDGDKSLCGIPWRVAFALQGEGWYLRNDVIWYKPNPMPESVTDRCTKSHEYLFMLAKSRRYFYDGEAVKESCSDDMQRRAAAGHTRGANGKVDESRCDADTLRGEHAKKIEVGNGRNRRTVWKMEAQRYKLRDDLSEEDRRYVLEELLRRGIL